MDRPHIITRHLGEALWVVRLEGEHDLASVPDLRQTVDEIYEKGTCLIVDVSAAAFIDSSILVELVRANERADASPDEKLAVVASPGSPAGRLCDLAGVDDAWFFRFDSMSTAIAWCNGQLERLR